jgi:hypothetical protein
MWQTNWLSTRLQFGFRIAMWRWKQNGSLVSTTAGMPNVAPTAVASPVQTEKGLSLDGELHAM